MPGLYMVQHQLVFTPKLFLYQNEVLQTYSKLYKQTGQYLSYILASTSTYTYMQSCTHTYNVCIST